MRVHFPSTLMVNLAMSLALASGTRAEGRVAQFQALRGTPGSSPPSSFCHVHDTNMSQVNHGRACGAAPEPGPAAVHIPDAPPIGRRVSKKK